MRTNTGNSAFPRALISFKVFSIFNPGSHFVHKTFSFDRVYYGGYLSCKICFNNEQGLKRRCRLKHYFILISGGQDLS